MQGLSLNEQCSSSARSQKTVRKLVFLLKMEAKDYLVGEHYGLIGVGHFHFHLCLNRNSKVKTSSDLQKWILICAPAWPWRPAKEIKLSSENEEEMIKARGAKWLWHLKIPLDNYLHFKSPKIKIYLKICKAISCLLGLCNGRSKDLQVH